MNTSFDFGSIAKEYDTWYHTSVGQKIDEIEKRLFSKYLSRINAKHLLEIGAGTGHWTQFLAQKGHCVTACDISAEMLKVASAKNIPNATFLTCDATSLPFPDHSADAVIAVTSIEFVKPWEKAFEEIKRVLKPGGYFLIGALNRKGSLAAIRKDIPTFKDAHFFTYKELVAELMTFGFPVVEGVLLMPIPQETNPEAIEKADQKADPRELNEKGNFLVGLVKKHVIPL